MKHLRSCGLLIALAFTALGCRYPVAPNPYTVSYDANTGVGTPPRDSAEYRTGDLVAVLGQGSLSKSGFSFAGWNTRADGSGIQRAVGTTFLIGDADVTLFAIWTQDPSYTVTYDANTGTGIPPTDGNNYQAGDSVTVLDKGNLTKGGYTFAGWNTLSNGQGTDRAAGSSFAMGTADVTLYAVWNPVQSAGITITYNASYEHLVFASSSVAVTRGASLSAAAADATLASQGSSWLWRMDGATLTGQTSGTLSLDTAGISIGDHILDLFVAYQGVLYSGNLLVTVTP